VIDFGVAKALGQKLTDKTLFTRFEQMIGTPAYMSPEQAALSGLDVDTRSEIYSLGVLLYELLTGVTPLDAETLRRAALDEVRRMIQETEPPKPSTRITDLLAADVRRLSSKSEIRPAATARQRGENPKSEMDRASLRRLLQQKKELISIIRGDLDWITMKAIEKDRRRRYETVNGLAADIERHLCDQPVAARPPSALYRLQKVARRHRVTFVAGTAVAIALVLGVIISTWQAVRATHAEREARNAQASEADQRKRAERSAEAADRNAAESRVRLVRQYVANGNRLGDEGDLLGALPWFAKALKEEQDPARAEIHRLRLGTTLQQCPKLVQVWFHNDVVQDTKFSPDGRWVITASSDRTARVWDTATGKPVSPPLEHTGPVQFAAFSPDGQRVATANYGFNAGVWDARSGRLLFPFLQHRNPVGHPTVVLRGSFSPDSRWVVTVSVDGTAQVHDLSTGEPLTTILPNLAAVRHAQFSPNSRLLATSSSNGAAQVWDLATGRPVSPPLVHTGLVNHVEFSPDGKLLVTAGSDRFARVWETASGRLVSEMRHRESVNYAWFTPDGRQIVTVNISVPDFFQSGGWAFRLAEREDITLSAAVSFHPEPKWTFGLAERQAITATWGQAQIWDVAAGRPVGPPRKLGTSVSQVAVSPDRRSVIPTCSAGALTENQVSVTDLVTGQPLMRPFQHDNGIIHASFSANGKWAVTASWDRRVHVWDATTGQPVSPRLTHQKRVYHASFSPDSRLVATASEDQTARVWDATTGEPVTPAFKHRAAVHRVLFTPDGRWLLTASVDGIVRVCELPKSNQPIEDELAQAELLAAHQIDDTGAVLPASPEGIQTAWLKWQTQIFREERMPSAATFAAQRAGSGTEDEDPEPAAETHPPLSPGHDFIVRALSTMNKLRSVHSSFTSFSSNEWAQVIEEFSRAIEVERDTGNLLYFFRSHGHEHLGQYQKAIDDCRESLWRMSSAPPDKSDIARDYLTRGQCYLRLGENEKAEADFQTAAELSPNDYRTYYQRALAYEQVGQFRKATNDFTEAIKRSANATNVLAQLYYQRGQNYLRLGENDKAEADFRRVPEYAPGDVMGYNNLAWFYVTGPATFRSPEKALPLALKAVELGQTNHNELNTLGVVYYRLGQLTNAIATLETGIKADSGGGSAHDFFFLAMSYGRLGDPARAQEYFLKATNWVAAQINASPNDKAELDAFRAEAEAVLGKPKAK